MNLPKQVPLVVALAFALATAGTGYVFHAWQQRGAPQRWHFDQPATLTYVDATVSSSPADTANRCESSRTMSVTDVAFRGDYVSATNGNALVLIPLGRVISVGNGH